MKVLLLILGLVAAAVAVPPPRTSAYRFDRGFAGRRFGPEGYGPRRPFPPRMAIGGEPWQRGYGLRPVYPGPPGPERMPHRAPKVGVRGAPAAHKLAPKQAHAAKKQAHHAAKKQAHMANKRAHVAHKNAQLVRKAHATAHHTHVAPKHPHSAKKHAARPGQHKGSKIAGRGKPMSKGRPMRMPFRGHRFPRPNHLHMKIHLQRRLAAARGTMRRISKKPVIHKAHPMKPTIAKQPGPKVVYVYIPYCPNRLPYGPPPMFSPLQPGYGPNLPFPGYTLPKQTGYQPAVQPGYSATYYGQNWMNAPDGQHKPVYNPQYNQPNYGALSKLHKPYAVKQNINFLEPVGFSKTEKHYATKPVGYKPQRKYTPPKTQTYKPSKYTPAKQVQYKPRVRYIPKKPLTYKQQKYAPKQVAYKQQKHAPKQVAYKQQKYAPKQVAYKPQQKYAPTKQAAYEPQQYYPANYNGITSESYAPNSLDFYIPDIEDFQPKTKIPDEYEQMKTALQNDLNQY